MWSQLKIRSTLGDRVGGQMLKLVGLKSAKCHIEMCVYITAGYFCSTNLRMHFRGFNSVSEFESLSYRPANQFYRLRLNPVIDPFSTSIPTSFTEIEIACRVISLFFQKSGRFPTAFGFRFGRILHLSCHGHLFLCLLTPINTWQLTSSQLQIVLFTHRHLLNYSYTQPTCLCCLSRSVLSVFPLNASPSHVGHKPLMTPSHVLASVRTEVLSLCMQYVLFLKLLKKLKFYLVCLLHLAI